MRLLLVAVGGAVGAVIRHLVILAAQRFGESAPRWAMVAVNITGSGVLALVATMVTAGCWPPAVLVAVGVGGCGALTTFSACAADLDRLRRNRQRRTALAYLLLTVVGAVVACFVGAAVGAESAEVGG